MNASVALVLAMIVPAEWAAAHDNPADFARYLDARYLAPPHIRMLSNAIRSAVLDGNGRLLVSEPPRHGKSLMCSQWSPAWFLELFPDRQVLLASYGAQFAAEWGRKVRNIVRDNVPRMLVRLSDDSRAVDRWYTTDGGGMATAGVGGPLTGRGADLLIVDDPVKDSEEARSDTIKRKQWEWWNETAYTRLEPGGSAIVIMTRWAEDDLVGRILEHEGDRWRHICLPAIAEDDDMLDRAAGEALWPGRFDVAALAEIRESIGSRAFAALYQQRPSPAGGGTFRSRDFRYWTRAADGGYLLHHDDGGTENVAPGSTWRAQTVDTALKVGEQNDWTAVVTAAVTARRQIIILDVHRERLEVPDQLPLIRRLRRQWRPRWTGVEEKASGVGIIQEARRRGIALKPLKADRDKMQRASTAAIMYEQHAVYHPRDAHWLADFEHELLAFPNGAHDDQVDALAHVANGIGGGPSSLVAAGRVRGGTDGTGMAEGDFRW